MGGRIVAPLADVLHRLRRWRGSEAFDFGARARYAAPCERLMRASGRPTNSTARATATATWIACGSALPMSSEANTIIRRAMNLGSSPPAIITAR